LVARGARAGRVWDTHGMSTFKLPARPRTIIIVALLVLVAIGIWFLRQATIVLDAPEPQIVSEQVDTLPPSPLSVVEAPVTYDLGTAIDSLEAAVPTTYGDLEQRIVTAKNKQVSFAFLLHRSKFRVRVVGQRVRISADIEYSGRIWYQPPIGPEIEVACGTGKDLPPRATLTLETRGELTRDWGLRTQSRLVQLEAYSDSARDRCRL